MKLENSNKYFTKNSDNNNLTNETQQKSEISEEEYEEYRKSLIFYRECPACHYIQGTISLGIGFFTIVRLQFLWQSLKWRGKAGYFLIFAVFSAFGFYKISYAYHIFVSQGKMKKKI